MKIAGAIYEKIDYKGKFSLLKGERDLIVKALNKMRTQKGASVKLGLSERNLNIKINRHRIIKDEIGQYFSQNKDL